MNIEIEMYCDFFFFDNDDLIVLFCICSLFDMVLDY